MRYLVQEIFGDEVTELIGDYWGLDREGELKGAFKPCGREARMCTANDVGRSGNVVSWLDDWTGEVLF